MKTTRRSKFDLIRSYFAFSKKKHNGKLRFIFSPEKLTGLFFLKEVKPTRDRNIKNTSNI